jgi:hypothetical protein
VETDHVRNLVDLMKAVAIMRAPLRRLGFGAEGGI